MTKYNEYLDSLNDLINNPNVSSETKQLAGLNHVGLEIITQLEQINKNLEKIANNTEKDNGVSIPTIQAIGNFFAEETKKIQQPNLDTIICNQNKDSYVDKNIILD